MQLSFRLDKRPGESHLALDGKKCDWNLELERSIFVRLLFVTFEDKRWTPRSDGNSEKHASFWRFWEHC